MPGFGLWDLVVKKGGHMMGYALLAAAYYYALTDRRSDSRLRYSLAIGLAVLYAASDEWHQSFTPGRTATIVDVGIDSIGGILGATAFRWKHRHRLTGNEAADGGAS